jgi:predicted PurR-regulated permease PerM
MGLLVALVSRVPARVETKLLAAFLTIVVLLIAMGAVGLRVLSGVNQSTEQLIQLQRKIAAYRQMQHDTTGQLRVRSASSISSAMTSTAWSLWRRTSWIFSAKSGRTIAGLPMS